MDIQAYAALWEEVKAHLTAHLEAMKAFHAREINLCFCEDYMAAIRTEENKIENHLRDIARNYTEALCHDAAKKFSTAGVRIDINRHEIIKAVGLDDDCLKLDVLKFWAELEKRYGGDKGKDVALQQQAAVIHDKFDMDRMAEVKTVAGTVVLTKRVYSEQNYRGRMELSYSTRDGLMQLMMALSAFAISVGRITLGHDLRRPPFSDHGFFINSRERYSFGDKELEIITFNNKFEFRFAQAVAEELMVFMGTYGPQALKQAA